jgi:glyoxylase-like metal-dependent hydrolase (beta-lactamase superfamily II)
MRRTTVLAALMLVAPLASHGQQPDWDAIEIKAEKVAGNVYMLYGVGGFAGGNIGVSVGEDGIVLVDDQFQPLVPKIKAALSGLTDQPVRFVLNTHHHGDHTHGNLAFGLESTIIAHDNVRARMAADDAFGGAPGTPAPASALPIVTFDSEVALHLNGEEIRGVHFPSGHTDGDTVVYFTGSNVVHMGDDFFNGMFPFIDLDGGGSVDGYIAAVTQILAKLPPDVKIIPGHGPLATRADLEANLRMLEATEAVIQQAIDDGKTLEQIKEEKLLAKWDEYSWAFITTDRHAEQLYRGLGGSQ